MWLHANLAQLATKKEKVKEVKKGRKMEAKKVVKMVEKMEAKIVITRNVEIEK